MSFYLEPSAMSTKPLNSNWQVTHQIKTKRFDVHSVSSIVHSILGIVIQLEITR